MPQCTRPNSPPKDAEYAEPPSSTKPGFFSCKNCIFYKSTSTKTGLCVYSRWSKSPPFNVAANGCCRFQKSDKWKCG